MTRIRCDIHVRAMMKHMHALALFVRLLFAPFSDAFAAGDGETS
jgi:hypothetical protein